jgi:osmotically-inducible protein OsmY
MESEMHGGNATEVVTDVTAEVSEPSDWPERATQNKGKKSKLTWSQAKVSQLLENLSEIDAKRIKLETERDEIKKQLATAVASL